MVKAPRTYQNEDFVVKKLAICILTLFVLVPLAPFAASADTYVTNTTLVLPYNGGFATGGTWQDAIPGGQVLFLKFSAIT
jgi:hypothetical protein